MGNGRVTSSMAGLSPLPPQRAGMAASAWFDPGERWTPLLVAVGALLVSMLGAFTAVQMAQRTTPSMALLLALPVAAVGGWLLLTRRAWLLALLLLARAPLDPVFAALSGSGLGPGAIVNALVLVLGLLAVLSAPRRFARTHVLLWLPMLVLLGLATWTASDRPQAVRLLLAYLSCFVMFFLPSFLLRRRTHLRHWLQVLVLASLVPSAAGLADLATGGQRYEALQQMALEAAEWLPSLDDDAEGLRVQGAYAHPNIYAFYIVSVLGALLLLIRLSQTRWSALMLGVAWGYAGLQLLLLMVTRTRSAWVAGALLLLAYALFVDRRKLKFLMLGTLGLPFLPVVRHRVADLLGAGTRAPDAIDSFSWRQALWESAWPWIQERWATGWGLESFNRNSTVFFPLETERGFDAHNVYVQLAFEGGLFAAAAYAMVFLGLLALAAAAWREQRPLAALLGALSLGYMLGSYSDNMHRYLVANWYWFFLMGLLAAALQEGLGRTATDGRSGRWVRMRAVPAPRPPQARPTPR
jgi:putative inorganic carbon (hco3(-)) transporter